MRVRRRPDYQRILSPRRQCRRTAEIGGEITCDAAVAEPGDRRGREVSARSQTTTRRPEREGKVGCCARAAAAEQVDVDSRKQARNRWCERLPTPCRDRDSDAAGSNRSVLLIDGRTIQQRDVARAAGEITVGDRASLKIRLRSVRQATAGRRQAEREVLRGDFAVVNHNRGNSDCNETWIAGSDGGIRSCRNAREGIVTVGVGCGCPAAERDRHAADGCATHNRSHRALDGASSAYRRTTRKSETADSRIEAQPAGNIVHIGVPECAAIGIESHGAVISPASTCSAAASRLRVRSLDEQLFSLAESIDRIGRQSSRILNGRKCGAARGTVAQGHVAGAIHRDTRHEAVRHVRSVRVPGRGLRHVRCHRALRNVNLVITRRGKTAGVAPAYGVGHP